MLSYPRTKEPASWALVVPVGRSRSTHCHCRSDIAEHALAPIPTPPTAPSSRCKRASRSRSPRHQTSFSPSENPRNIPNSSLRPRTHRSPTHGWTSHTTIPKAGLSRASILTENPSTPLRSTRSPTTTHTTPNITQTLTLPPSRHNIAARVLADTVSNLSRGLHTVQHRSTRAPMSSRFPPRMYRPVPGNTVLAVPAL